MTIRFFATYGETLIVDRAEFNSSDRVQQECDRFFPTLPVAIWSEEERKLTLLLVRNPGEPWTTINKA